MQKLDAYGQCVNFRGGPRYLNLHRAAQWDIYYRFSHNVSLDGG